MIVLMGINLGGHVSVICMCVYVCVNKVKTLWSFVHRCSVILNIVLK